MLTFRTFKDQAGALELMGWLHDHDIPAETEDTSLSFDPSFAHSILTKEYAVRINSTDFERASEALYTFYAAQLNKIPPDYYLFTFSDDELLDILKRPDQWGDLDYALAQEILSKRGKEVTTGQLAGYKTERVAHLSQPDVVEGKTLVRWGFWLSIFGGIIGSLIGWHLAHSYKILPDGSRVYTYTDATRARGRLIFEIGIGLTIVVVILRLYLGYTSRSDISLPVFSY